MHYKSVFLSDVHLGTPQCKSYLLLKFLKENSFDELYLLGDIVDIWAMKAKWYWPEEHNTVVQKILRLSRKGTKVVYITGNHDEALRQFLDENELLNFGGIEITNHFFYVTELGKKYLLVHGDQYDGAIRSYPLLYWIGDKAYDVALKVNTVYNWWRKLFKLEYWSLSAYLKSKVKGAMAHVAKFDEIAVRECEKYSVDGMIYGHTHTPSSKNISGYHVVNSGDTVENCTFVAETEEGIIKIFSMTTGKELS
jgi:UDP-2,3-diacylglucosamine pyrophosphatase LpxH